MWKCPECGEELEDQFDECWQCAGVEVSQENEEPLDSHISESVVAEEVGSSCETESEPEIHRWQNHISLPCRHVYRYTSGSYVDILNNVATWCSHWPNYWNDRQIASTRDFPSLL